MRVLVVDDEVRLADALQRGLQAEGFAVDVAHDGEQGLHLATERAYDLVVLDVMLPKLNGYRVCQRLRAAGNWVPVLMLSAKDGEYDQAEGLDVGADDYLVKPFSYVVLVARLRALARRGAPQRPTVLRAGDLSLDPARRQVRRGGVDVELTPREFALLECLLRRRDEVVSKQEILEHVWDAHYAGDPNVVEVYVGYLRRKIDTPFGRHAVQTVRGAGYRLVGTGGEAERRRRGRQPGPRARLRGWWRRRSLRARLTMLATLVVAVGLVAGSVLLLLSLESALRANVDGTVRQQADDVAALVDQDRLPDPIPGASTGNVLLQVVDSRGRVLAASLGSDRAVPLLSPERLKRASDGRPRSMDGARIGEREPLRVITRAAGPAGDRVTVIAAASFASVSSSLRIVQLAVLVGVPLLLALVAGTAWATVGSTLRPVGRLRMGAEEITGMGGTRRLPLPTAHDEIRRLADTLNRMLDRLDQAGGRQRAFVADAAHELRSPLAGMQAQLEVALRHPDPASWRQVAAAVLEDTLRLGRMVEDLLALARLDEGRGGRPSGVVDLGEIAREVVERQPEPGVELRLDVAGAVWARGDASALSRVVQNLLDNALRHATSRVEVSVRAEGALSVLVVADDGPGIDAANRERVFERYARLDDARSRDAGGTGLGLAIVREIVRAHQGAVTVEEPVRSDGGASAGTGARLVVRLPAERAPGARISGGPALVGP